ncbi:hypothetical protein HID58_023345 [Brassica napus]|uniref:Squalene monooxygenase n=1 Tax=Brassica napus TaxID=3708 RepID=A0ABQ8D1T0_BRANA|nr:hypothetical protein HID58_023345 [Brassica napus]
MIHFRVEDKDIILTWMVFHLIKRKKVGTEETEVDAEETRDGEAHDVIIVGAGVAGAALAYALAKEIDAQEIKSLAIYKDGKNDTLYFPDNKNFPYESAGRLLRNGRLVQRLRKKAASHANVQLEEGTVKFLIEEKGVVKGVIYKNSAGEEITAFAPLTVVCDGCYSNLRRSAVHNKEEVLSYFVGYVTKNTRLEDPHSMHLIFSKPLPCVVYQITSNEVRCAAEVPADSIPSIANGEMVNFLKKTVAPQIPDGNLRETFLKGCDKKGVIVLGDAFNMRHPIIASGMMVALSDVLILRNLLRPVPSFSNTKKFVELVNQCLNTLAHVFSEVLVAITDEAREGMRESCFNYLSRTSGGFRTSGMMAILGGMNPRPLSLVFHLVCITLTAMGHLLSPFPSPRRFWHSLRVFALALKMLGAHLGDEGLKEMLIPTNAASYRKSYMTTASDC